MSIEIRDVNKRFGDFVALEDVNVSLPTGQLTALLGPSGGGKSSSIATMRWRVESFRSLSTLWYPGL